MNAATSTLPPHDLDSRLAELSQQVAWLVARQERQEELWSELMPVGRDVLTSLAGRLDVAEKKGWLDLGREAVKVGERVLEHYSADDVRMLGDAIVTILDTVRALTQPTVISIAADAAAALDHAAEAKPVSLFGAMRATRDADVQQGIAVVLDVLRKIGRGLQPRPAGREQKLASVLGPRRRRELSAGAPMRAAQTAPVAPTAAAPRPPPANGPAPEWSKEVAASLAGEAGIALTATHWAVIDVARADFAKTKASPNLRRLTQLQPLTTKEIYALFPRAPGRTIAKIAGLPKPAGCL